jgi:hypothetical protein
MVSSELHQPEQGGVQAMDLMCAPFLQDSLAESPAIFGTVVTRSHHLCSVPKRNKHDLYSYNSRKITYIVKFLYKEHPSA